MKLIFDAETHTYFDENKSKLPSVNEITQNWLGNKFANINKETLQKAIEKGIDRHQELERFLMQGIKPKKPSYEFKCFMKMWDKQFVACQSEQMVYGATEYGAYAGTFDLLDTINGNIVDIKTNYSLDKEYVQIQLSLYAMALRQNDVIINRGYVIHLPPEKSPEKPQILEIKLLSEEECELIVKAYFDGTSKPQAKLECLNETAIVEFGNAILSMEKAEMTIKEYKDKILAEMESRGINQIKIGNNITISYIAPTTRESIDTAKLKKEMPIVADKYKKISNVKSSVRITTK